MITQKAGNPIRSFRPGVAEKLGYYVYRLVDPREEIGNGVSRTFYIGKGQGDRVFSHLWDAEAALERPPEERSKKEQRIIDIWNSKRDVAIVIHRHGMSEKEAFLVEAALIDMHPEVETDSEYRTNKQRGHHANALGMKTVDEINHQYAAQEAELLEPIALIKINRRWAEYTTAKGVAPQSNAIYEMTRGWWKVNPDNHPKVKRAAAVAFGLIREVFDIDDWTPRDANDRCAFNGRPSDDRSLVGKYVGHIFPTGAQTPVRWFYPGQGDQLLNKAKGEENA